MPHASSSSSRDNPGEGKSGNALTPDRPRERILIVDDDELTRGFLIHCLRREGYAVVGCSLGREALEALLRERFDLVLLDLRLPDISGLDLLREVHRHKAPPAEPEIVVISAENDIETAVQAMKLGASDYLRKPMGRQDLVFGVERALERHRLREENRLYQTNLERLVRQQSDKIQSSLLRTIEALSRSLGAKDTYSLDHSRRVMEISLAIAGEMELSPQELENIKMGALLHDIGKIGVREGVLQKEMPLEAEEVDHIHCHPLIAENILGPIEDLREIIELIKHHHERWDGTGYPDGLKEKSIPLGARIIAVGDAYDAMTSERSYNQPLSHSEARRRILTGAGTHFDPEVAEIFGRIYQAPPSLSS